MTLGNALFQLTARVDAVKAVVCQLHPEVATQLEEKIRKDQEATAQEFKNMERMLELLNAEGREKIH